MDGLVHARITPLDENNQPQEAKAFAVQFNPATLRFQTSAQPQGGGQQSAVPRQAATNAKTSLSLDLHFDTYDEAEGSDPVPVTRKTAQMEQFLKPIRVTQAGAPVPPPPRIRFLWGAFDVTGVVTQLSTEYDHFHHSGAPLRAKCSLALEVQDQALAAPPAASGTAGGGAPGGVAQPGLASPARGPLAGLSGPGAGGNGPGALTKGALAQAGESLAAFAQRNGLDPRNWRDLAQGIPDVAALPAGLEITFDAQATGRGGRNARGGAGGGGAPRQGAGLGTAVPSAEAVTAAGGPAAMAATRRAAREAEAVAQARQAFALPDQAAPARLAAPVPDPARAGLAVPAGPGSAGQGGQAADRPFGLGIPLRPRLGPGPAQAAAADWNTRSAGHRRRGGAGCGCDFDGKP